MNRQDVPEQHTWDLASLFFTRSIHSTYSGVDMTTPEPIEKAFGVLDDIINKLEALS